MAVAKILSKEYIEKYKPSSEVYVRQEPYVNNEGIYVPCEAYVPEGCASSYRCIMTKEMFIDAYKKYIKPNNRLYKGGWKR